MFYHQLTEKQSRCTHTHQQEKEEEKARVHHEKDECVFQFVFVGGKHKTDTQEKSRHIASTLFDKSNILP